MVAIHAIFVTILLLCSVQGLPQGRDTTARIDTADKISAQAQDLFDIRQQQREDSIQRRALEEQLLSVKMSERQEKQKLLAEINVLRSRDSILYAKRKRTVDSLRSLNSGTPVAPFRDTLFRIYTYVGSYSPRERAASIESRIRSLAENYKFEPDSLTLSHQENNWVVFWNDQMIASVDEHEAMWADVSTEQLARDYFTKIKESIDGYREETSLKRLASGIAFACLIILTVTLIIIGIGKMIGWIKRRLLASRNRIFTGFKIKGYELVSPNQQVKFFWTILHVLQWILILTSVYLALPVLLNLFPSTEGYAPILLGYFIKPLKDVVKAILGYLPNLITIVVICFIFRYLLKALRFFATELHEGVLSIPGFYREWAMPTYQILRVLLFAFLLIVIFPYLPGSESPIFKGVSVFIGVLFTFGSAGALGNIVAGLVLTYMRPFSVGDRIKIGEVTGDIIEKSLLVTRIRTTKNEVISIPNSQVMNSHTINYSMDVEENPLIVYTHITMAYEIPWARVHELARQACDRVEFLEKQPEPFILQTSLDDFYVTYQVNAYTRNPHRQALIYSELHKNILDVFHEAGIELLSPHFRAVRDGSALDMPKTDDSEK
ncbi:mechanosensitive ion channel family protein [Parapedobacter sp. SGR-10]|uniref:mechanosensitive ion channel family protein n=1 Tax=Parapedobacter sp. SGR-10 TaxID=2710879 RepID=UPI0013D47008|nr:mechanosensitive ion channel family protein [Parapedobacter sp. SGR-10]NGF54991.1 mechanosensitive ion channel family protein [Parapedobacter sp. SGR-10]